MDYSLLAEDTSIQKTKTELEAHNVKVLIAETGDEAKKMLLELIPEGSEVMTATSTTIDQLGITPIINESGKYNAIKAKLITMDRNTQSLEMQKLGSAPEFVTGSVHAVTEDGKIVVASGSGSQLSSYVYGSAHVIWVVSTKKIVPNLDTALKRVYEFVLPQEDARMKKVHGPQSGSSVNKLFILNKELKPNRITLIFVKADLGF